MVTHLGIGDFSPIRKELSQPLFIRIVIQISGEERGAAILLAVGSRTARPGPAVR